MLRKRIFRRILLISLLLVFLPFLLFASGQEALVFQFQNSGHVLAYIPILKKDTFQIKYTHSIHLSDVTELYQVTQDKKIKQYELIYEDYAIGMPEGAANGEVFVQADGKFYIKNMNRIFPSFDLRIGKVRANHTVIYKEKEYPLSHYLEPGTWVRIKIQRIYLWQKWKGVNILEQSI